MNPARELARLQTKAFPLFLQAFGEIYVRSGGRIGHRLLGVPSLIVRTVGAKSGEPRTTVLTYVSDGRDVIVVASLGGAPRNPAWLHNFVAAGTVEVQIGTERFTAAVTKLLPGDADYQRLWDLADANNNGRYSAYQRKTSRAIPVVRLRRV